jgi:aspartate racemase
MVDRAVAEDGVDGVILGCTELGLLVGPDDLPMPTFDTTELHARAAMDFALG